MKLSGFTLIELLLTIAIIGIVAALSFPGYTALVTGSRLSSEANALLQDIQLAKSEAIKRGQDIIVCPSTNQSSCTTSSWQGGWIVLAPTNGNCSSTGSPGDPVIRAKLPLTSSDTITYIPNKTAKNLCFNRLGLAPAADTGIFKFNSNPVVTNRRRCVTVSSLGHAQVLTYGKKDSMGVVCN